MYADKIFSPDKRLVLRNITDYRQPFLTPFLTVKDFDTLRLETDAFGHSVITGVFLQNKSPIWREATKKSIGKRIAFVFNDTVITAPLINIPLESGHFQISNPHGYDLERIFKELQKEKK